MVVNGTVWKEVSDRVRWDAKTSVEGELLSVKEFVFDGRQSFNYVLLTTDGEKVVNGHKELNDAMAKLKIGDSVKIDYLGERKGRKRFKVFLAQLAPDTTRSL